MIALVASVFVASLLGSVHCVAMCGSFACLAASGHGSARPAARRAAAYHLGRLIAYASLGLLAGTAGAGLDRVAIAGVARPAAVVAGALLILWGVASLLAALGVRVPQLDVPPSLASLVARGVRAADRQSPARRALLIGLLTAALPCGWLYAFVATSAAAGSALGGAAVMVAFWLGTVPLLAAVGLGAQRLLGPVRRRMPALTAGVLIVIGALTAAGRLVPHGTRATHEVPVEAHVGHDAGR